LPAEKAKADAEKSQCALTAEEAKAELETLLINYKASNSSSSDAAQPKIILLVDQMHRLALAGDAGIAVLQQLFQWAHAPTSRLIFIGLTSRAQLPQSMLGQVQYSVSPITLTVQAAAQIQTVIEAPLWNILHKDAVRQWIDPATGGGDQQLAMRLCFEAVHIAMENNSNATQVSFEHLRRACNQFSIPIKLQSPMYRTAEGSLYFWPSKSAGELVRPNKSSWGGTAWLLRNLKLPVNAYIDDSVVTSYVIALFSLIERHH
jgi:hypothetical protein